MAHTSKAAIMAAFSRDGVQVRVGTNFVVLRDKRSRKLSRRCHDHPIRQMDGLSAITSVALQDVYAPTQKYNPLFTYRVLH
jgi:hypothetical protein